MECLPTTCRCEYINIPPVLDDVFEMQYHSPENHIEAQHFRVRCPKRLIENILEVSTGKLLASKISRCRWAPSVERSTLELITMREYSRPQCYHTYFREVKRLTWVCA